MTTDYGHPLEFAYFLTPDASDPQGVLDTARLVDGLGYDLLGVQDHPYQPHHLDTMSLLAAILAQTRAVRVFAAVGNLPLRPPAVLAKAAATLDLLSGGRFELAGVHPGPAPAHSIQIWIGADKPRALALTGRVADGWVAPLMNYRPPRDAAEGNVAIDRAARDAGRDPRDIRRIYNIPGAITSTTPAPATDSDQAIVGPPEHWAEVLTHLALDLGFSTFMLAAPPDPETLTAFIEDVAPLVRERVADQRAAQPA